MTYIYALFNLLSVGIVLSWLLKEVIELCIDVFHVFDADDRSLPGVFTKQKAWLSLSLHKVVKLWMLNVFFMNVFVVSTNSV